MFWGRPSELDMGTHFIFTKMSMTEMSNEEKQYYLLNLYNKVKR